MKVGIYLYEDLIQNRFQRFLKPEFVLNNTIPNESLVIRLLLGLSSFTNTITSTKFDQMFNYSDLGIGDNRILHSISTKIIKNCFEPEVKINLVCDYLKETKILNKVFFENLLIEITSYFQRSQEGSHTTAFLHLYRIIEFISYSFPLIYASISREYYGSFNRMKNYFDKAKNELLFFDNFLNDLLGGKNLLESHLEINFNSFDSDLNKNHFRIIKSILNNEMIIEEVQDTSISIKYEHLLFLTINLRNRYFHFAVGGQRNIRTAEIYESDLFFQLINEDVMNWISVIYFEILKISSTKQL